MKVFVSHSMKDKDLINSINENFKRFGFQLLIAEHQVDFTKSITDKIKDMIFNCDVGLVLLTKYGLDSGFVREEIGYLEGLKKPSLIIYEKGYKSKYDGGFNYGKDYIELDCNNPQFALERARNILLDYWDNKFILHERSKLQKNNTILGLTTLIGFLLLASDDNC